MAEKKLNVYLVFTITVAAVAAASLFLWPGGLLFVLIIGVSFGMETLMLRFGRREIFRRMLPLENWWDALMIPVIAVCAIASAALSVYDAAVLEFSLIQSFLTAIGGIVLLMSAFMIAIQSLRAQPPHGLEKYDEPESEERERGPYEVVRHPIMLAVLLAGLSIPLFFGSGIGFIPIGIMLIAVVTRVAAEDDWRFNNYEWFYDYTKEVSYRLIPFIW